MADRTINSFTASVWQRDVDYVVAEPDAGEVRIQAGLVHYQNPEEALALAYDDDEDEDDEDDQ